MNKENFLKTIAEKLDIEVEKLKEIFEKLTKNSKEALEELEEAIKNNNFEKIENIAKYIKEHTSNLEKLSSLLKELEKKEDIETTKEWLDLKEIVYSMTD